MEATLGFHVMPHIRTGVFATRVGAILAGEGQWGTARVSWHVVVAGEGSRAVQGCFCKACKCCLWQVTAAGHCKGVSALWTVQTTYLPTFQKAPRFAGCCLLAALSPLYLPSPRPSKCVRPFLSFSDQCSSPGFAGALSFHITIHGRGGHAAMPHGNIDPIVAAGAVITGLQVRVCM